MPKLLDTITNEVIEVYFYTNYLHKDAITYYSTKSNKWETEMLNTMRNLHDVDISVPDKARFIPYIPA